ncbi:MAG: nuclear transport factor 2 family protein [Acidobacteriaceae bacterium]
MKMRVAILVLGLAAVGGAQTGARTSSAGQATVRTGVRAQKEVGDLIREFLSKVNDPAMHNRFWADDLIYTSAAGKVKTKAEIMESMRNAPKAAAGDTSTYSAEQMQVRQYGDVAVAAFELVHRDGSKVDHYRNTGTFVKRDGRWQAVAWQATKVE